MKRTKALLENEIAQLKKENKYLKLLNSKLEKSFRELAGKLEGINKKAEHLNRLVAQQTAMLRLRSNPPVKAGYFRDVFDEINEKTTEYLNQARHHQVMSLFDETLAMKVFKNLTEHKPKDDLETYLKTRRDLASKAIRNKQ